MSRAEIAETAVIFLSLFAVMPRAFGYYRPWYGVVLILVLLLMAAVAVRRIAHLSAFFRSHKR
jgi:high-affinity Fe2+/Pb2+ permease